MTIVHATRTSQLVWQFALLGILMPTTLRADDFFWEQVPVSDRWDAAGNWVGPLGSFPDDNTDSATVSGVNSLDPTLRDSNRTVGALIISSNGDVNTGDGTTNFSLLVQSNGGLSGTTTIDGLGSTLTVYQGPSLYDLDTDNLVIQNTTGTSDGLQLRDGAQVQVDAQLMIEPDGDIEGAGIVEISGSSVARNRGLITASGGTLVLEDTGTGYWDIDGNPNPVGGDSPGSLAADDNATLIVDSNWGDNSTFLGRMTIGEDAIVQVNQPWSMVTNISFGADLNLEGGNGAATLTGAAVTIEGDINVNSGIGILAAPALISPSLGQAITIQDEAQLQFDAPASIDDPDAIIHSGFSTGFIVNDIVTIGTGSGNFDWDGQTVSLSRTTVNATGVLNIDVDKVDAAAAPERVTSLIMMKSGDINVQNDAGQWELNGSLRMDNSDDDVPVLSGVEVLLTGGLNVDGNGVSEIAADVIFADSVSVSVEAGAALNWTGTSAILDGSFTGEGDVLLDADTTEVPNPLVISMPDGRFDMDGLVTGDQLVLNSTLQLNVESVDIEGNGIDDDLRINTMATLNVQQSVPTLYRIDSDVDLNATGGIGFSTHFLGDDVEFAGSVDVTGNSVASARVDVSGDVNVGAGSQWRLGGGTIAQPNRLFAGATFGGAGAVVNAGGAVALEGGAVVGVQTINRGHFAVGFFANASAMIQNDFVQETGGTLELDIDGTAAGQFDQLIVTGDVDLDGTIHVPVNERGGNYVDPEVPGTFDEFTLVVANGAVNGVFDDFIYDGDALVESFNGAGMLRYHVGDGLFRILDYDPSQVDLLNYKALEGDANGDGVVDGVDFIIWNANKFTDGNDWTTGDFNGDGFTDGSDFILWNANKFVEVPLGAPATPGNPFSIPEPGGLALILGCGMFISSTSAWRRATLR